VPRVRSARSASGPAFPVCLGVTPMRPVMPIVADGVNEGLTRFAEAEPPVKPHDGPVVACSSQACRDQLPQEGGSLLHTVLDVDEGTVALRLGDLEQPPLI
jgi:hypothetical protein